jgi:preprotein translocase subunit SecA
MIKSIEKALSKLVGGTSNEKFLKRVQPVVQEINRIAKEYSHLTDDELKAKTPEFRYRLKTGETLDDLLPEAFAAVKDTCRRLIGKKWMVRGQENEWNMIPYDVQLVGAIALHEGNIAEMATGEGKTLVASMPLYLNALEGKGAHLVTVNEYLAQRDCEWMGQIYEFLGLRTAAIIGDMDPAQKRDAYNADISYGTNNEFGFDYLRDNMSVDVWSVVQRPLHYAIVDEVDSVLIDEARTPLIISGAVGAPRNVYYELKPVVANLYKRQKELVDQLVREGKTLLESDEEAGGLMLLRAQRGDPKNPALLKLLTSEFWVKKLIEKIQGQYEINKNIGEVDAELYFTIDEKSNVVDITEKGRIFLSGGRDEDIVFKIQLLDELDANLAELSEKKNAARFFTQDPVNGFCNGFTFEGKLALARIQRSTGEEELNALNRVAQRISELPDAVNQLVQQKNLDKNSAWHSFFNFSKKQDKTFTDFTKKGIEFISQGGSGAAFENAVQDLQKLLAMISEWEDQQELTPRALQERRRLFLESLFQLHPQTGAPIALTEQGKVAILAMRYEGVPFVMPFISRMISMLEDEEGSGTTSQGALSFAERKQEYFEFSENRTFIKRISEKGRIAMLGGNPDLYVLPDRSAVEERDRQIQSLLDRTLNQANYDYADRIRIAEKIQTDFQQIGLLVQDQDLNYFETHSVYGQDRWRLSQDGKFLLSDFSEQTLALAEAVDREISKSTPDKLFAVDSKGRWTGLNLETLDRLMGVSFIDVQTKIKEWHRQEHKDVSNDVQLRQNLDSMLLQAFPKASQKVVSLSRRYEELDRMQRIVQYWCHRIFNDEFTDSEKMRSLHRYFRVEGQPNLGSGDISLLGLTAVSMRALNGEAAIRLHEAELLFKNMEDPDTELDGLFELNDKGIPIEIQKAARAILVDGLPYFSFSQELSKFRDQILKIASKKANNRQELESLLPKDKVQLRSNGFLLDEREMNELLSKAHAPGQVISNEEIEHWCQIHFDRKPRTILEQQRERYWKEYTQVEERIQNISQLLKAYTLFHADVDYVVKSLDDEDMRSRGRGGKRGKAVVIVDQFTGRLMPGRRFSDGLHEALEAKEGVEVQAESQTLATITLQNFFRIYKKLSGMTGTAETEAQEFFSTYKLDVKVIPTNKPVIRDDRNDVIFRTKNEKYQAIIDEAIQMHDDGRAVLIGTISVDVSQRLSELLQRRGVPLANWLKKGDVSKEIESGRVHTVLNAKFHTQEAEIVAKAGQPGMITIATNMAGRGTDIKLHPQVLENGGLHIIGSEKHESRRIDRQLRGRAGRQGDPGSSRFYLSLEDDLMRLFGSDRITNVMSRLGQSEENERIEHPLITKSIERAQKKVEERNFEIRKNLLEYDNVLNEQRKIIYKRRQNLLGFAQPVDLIESKAKRYFNEEDDTDKWDLDGLVENLTRFFGRVPEFTKDDLYGQKAADIKSIVAEWIEKQIDEDQHLRELQIRHRLFGYVDRNGLISEIVRSKIQLHNAGTDDVSKWNMEGIHYEISRIFSSAPDWLDSQTSFSGPQEVKDRLTQWAVDLIAKEWDEKGDRFSTVIFGALPLHVFLQVYIIALMNFHLRVTEPTINWRTEEFLNDLERVFYARPQLGSNEIRNIRRDKLSELLVQWLDSLNINEDLDLAYRHRILGYLSSFYFLGAAVEYCFRNRALNDGSQILRLNKEHEQFLQSIVPADFSDLPETSDADLYLNTILEKMRVAFLGKLRDDMDAYDSVMIANATIEELIQASTVLILEQALHRNKDRAGWMAKTLEFAFMKRPEKGLPNSQEKLAIDSYREDLIAWALKHHHDVSYHDERVEQERLSSEIVRDSVFSMIEDTIYTIISQHLGNEQALDDTMLTRIQADCRVVFRQAPAIQDDNPELMEPGFVMDQISAWSHDLYQKRVDDLGSRLATRYERYYVLEKIDENWRQHLSGIDELREGIGLRGYGQKDPLIEYKSEAYKMFVQTIERINRDVVSTLFKVFDIGGELAEQQMRRAEPKNFVTTHSQVETFKASRQAATANAGGAQNQPAKPQTVVKTSRVGRNDPCPCGSGKKYKHCCGRNA